MALSRDVLLKLISALPDDAIIQALSQSGIQVGDQGGGMDPLQGMDASQTDGPKSWKDLTIEREPDDRPDLTKKDYIVEKLAMDQPAEMPHDGGSGGGDYARPF